MKPSATWDLPDFADPRFAVERVDEVGTCRHEDCEHRGTFVIEYSMRRDRWTYVYECCYCDEHLPQAAIDWLAVN